LAAQEPGPCAQVTAACKSAGFVEGGASTGTGLQVDCVFPIMQGIAQPAAATRPLPHVDPQVIAACKTRHPDFGQGKGPSPTALAAQVPASAALPLAAQPSASAPIPSAAATATHLPNAPLPALTAPAAGTGSIAVEMETTSGGKTPLGNATSVTMETTSGAKTPRGNATSVTDGGATHGVSIRFGAGNQQAKAVQSCLAGCILSHVIITETARSSGGVSTPTVVYTLTNSTVAAVMHIPLAGPYTGKPADALQVTFTYEKIDVQYPAHPTP
jgi:hypothetical protein